MVAEPVLTPNTIPEPSTEATPALEEDQVPPVAASVSVMEAPTHTLVGPDIEPATGAGLTLSEAVAVAEEQPVVTV